MEVNPIDTGDVIRDSSHKTQEEDDGHNDGYFREGHDH